MLDISQLNYMLVPELRELAEQIGLKGYKRLKQTGTDPTRSSTTELRWRSTEN